MCMKKLQKRLFYVALVGVLLVIGGSFAFFAANFVGLKEQVINLNGLKFRYTEDDTELSIASLKTMTD